MPSILDLAVNCYDFDYPVLENDNGVEVDNGNNANDESDDDCVDDENKENVEPVTFTPEQERDNQVPKVQLRVISGMPFERQ